MEVAPTGSLQRALCRGPKRLFGHRIGCGRSGQAPISPADWVAQGAAARPTMVHRRRVGDFGHFEWSVTRAEPERLGVIGLRSQRVEARWHRVEHGFGPRRGLLLPAELAQSLLVPPTNLEHLPG